MTNAGHALLTQVGSIYSWTLPCVSSLVPSVLHLSHGFQCSSTFNRQPYEGRFPPTSWLRKSSNVAVGQFSLISLTHHCYDWHPGSRCGWTCNQLTSKVDGSTEKGHCGVCRRKRRLTDTDLCPCGETQTMFHIVESCPLTKLNGSLSRLHSADKDAVSWLIIMVHDTHTRRRTYISRQFFDDNDAVRCKYLYLWLSTCCQENYCWIKKAYDMHVAWLI